MLAPIATKLELSLCGSHWGYKISPGIISFYLDWKADLLTKRHISVKHRITSFHLDGKINHHWKKNTVLLRFSFKYIFLPKYQVTSIFAQNWAQSNKPRNLAREVTRHYQYLSKMSVLRRISQFMRFTFCLKRMEADNLLTEFDKTNPVQRAKNSAKE